ncbi:type II toxin-antitoxin system VapC family toxin [Rhodopila sp.]|jgi:predicted nucleic acid-binding protein|uniref:type II toxin-antitoxin system VapC family toxin n=1 Tax=Rhodopila sp. TaxID=2480087 RepID=UPI002B99F70D|nr:type II toxin-antitoxin system VapC family toxin [Rhodopila sp.]HVZ06702.1 type II toxin-antitoxin system VapC family toxin [Rhodopila sp.]
MAEWRGRISQTGMPEAMNLLRSLPLEIDEPPSLARCEVVLDLMRTYRLTAYDAAYLELAQRRGLSLATRDRDLLVAAPTAGVTLFAVAP